MKIKRYFAADMRQAIRLVREEQGPDAVILSNRRVNGGVEIVAAVDYDEAAVQRIVKESRQATPEPKGRERAEASAPSRPGAPVAPETPPLQALAEPKPEVVWSQDPSLVAMRQEIATLRSMLESQLTGLAWGQMRKRQPARVKLLERLMQLGLSPALCRELADQVHYQSDIEHNWRQALGLLSRRLPVTDDDILTHGGVVALVGATGVGKTTTVAKLAARYALRHGPGRVALVTTDGYRIGAYQQLRTYGRILGAPVHVAEDAKELRLVLDGLAEKGLVLIDTAGMSPRDVRLSEQFAMLRGGSPTIRTYAVLSATTQRAALDQTTRALANVDLDGCILTKLDESSSLGEALAVVGTHQLPVAYISDGQRVPEDLHPARANNLVSRAVTMMKTTQEKPAEEAMALAFGRTMSTAHG